MDDTTRQEPRTQEAGFFIEWSRWSPSRLDSHPWLADLTKDTP